MDELKEGIADNAKLVATEKAKMDAGNEQLEEWNQQQLNKYGANELINDPKKYIHKVSVQKQKAAAFSDKQFLSKLDEMTTIYRADGTKVDGNLDHDNIVPKSLLPDTVEEFEIEESHPLEAPPQKAATKLDTDFKAHLAKVLVSKGATAAQAHQVWQHLTNLGEGREQSLERLQATAMQKAIEILEVDQQKVRLDAEHAGNISKIPASFHEVAKQLMAPAELDAYIKVEARSTAEAQSVRNSQTSAIRKVVESHLMGSMANKRALEASLDKMPAQYGKGKE